MNLNGPNARSARVSPTKLAVVIPFYQREPGFLHKAVTSVFAQRLSQPAQVEVIVVDDASPASVSDEALPEPPPGFALRVLYQANGGAGAARNAGLDAIGDDVEFVAFLDSDDGWYDDHLERALNALVPGVDLYFSNNFADEGDDAFGYSSYMRARAAAGAPGSTGDTLGCVEGTEIFDRALSDIFIHTSQAVFRRAPARDLRFSTDLRRSGEDLLFFIELARRIDRVAFTAQKTGFRGRGVSIYRETLGWGSPLALETTVDELILRKRIARRFPLSHEQSARLGRERRKLYDHLTFLAARNLVRHPRLVLAALARLTRYQPGAWTHIPRALLALPGHRARLLRAAAARPAPAS